MVNEFACYYTTVAINLHELALSASNIDDVCIERNIDVEKER